MDALTLTVPTTLHHWARGDSLEVAQAQALATVQITRNLSQNFTLYVDTLTSLLYGVLAENNLRDEVNLAAKAVFGKNSPPFSKIVA